MSHSSDLAQEEITDMPVAPNEFTVSERPMGNIPSGMTLRSGRFLAHDEIVNNRTERAFSTEVHDVSVRVVDRTPYAMNEGILVEDRECGVGGPRERYT